MSTGHASESKALRAFGAPTRTWFSKTFDGPTPIQEEGWQRIASGQDVLLLAPTGSGKTLAAFFWAIDKLMRDRDDADKVPGVRVLYISPLKALAYDIERNLRAPLVGSLRAAEALGEGRREVGVDIRTGDTPAESRRRQLKRPEEILVTTPESLFLMLGSQARETLRTVHTIIVDEIHAVAPSKRGAHLALSLERLTLLCAEPPQRIGLSATVQPHLEAARFLSGGRPVAVIDRSAKARLDLTLSLPVADREPLPELAPVTGPHDDGPGGSILGKISAAETPAIKGRDARGIWAVAYPELLGYIRNGRATLIFVNSRSLCERVAQHLNDLAEEELVRAHHGSLAHGKRKEIEEALKEGQLKGIVATSSLELGIDMGAVDLVILLESPGSVSRGLQRVGRAGHGVGQKSRGILMPKFKGDLLECAVVANRMRLGELEPIRVPQNPLDVLAQHLVAMCLVTPQSVDTLFAQVRGAYPFGNLTREGLVSVLDMLSGTYPSDEFQDFRPHLSWDRHTDLLTARPGARMVSMLNAGTIPDRGMFGVFLGEGGPRVGELDEEMVHEMRRGDVFMLGASSWRAETITRDRVLVVPAPGESGRIAFWRGEGPGRPIELGRALGEFVREVGYASKNEARRQLTQNMGLTPEATQSLLDYIDSQKEATGTLPTDRAITFERFRDELGDWRICILSPFGGRVHAPWAMALERSLSGEAGYGVETMYTDEGIVLRLPGGQAAPDLTRLMLDPTEVEELVIEELASSALFASTFRENAARALLMPKRRAQARAPLWQQRLRAKVLLAAAQKYPSFPIVLETYRQCLRDIFDLSALKELLGALNRRDILAEEVETSAASPFARGLAFSYVANYLYDQDAPLAERRAQALTLDRTLLGELLGQVELRELIDRAVLDEVEANLLGLGENTRPRNAEEALDLLRRIGPLTEKELAARGSDEEAAAWAQALLKSQRIFTAKVFGKKRLVAIEDAARLRDAFGVMPPGALPERFLSRTENPLEHLVGRYARTHGPFTQQTLAQAFQVTTDEVMPHLNALTQSGALVHGALRPGGHALEWCDAEVLRRLKRATLAKLRNEVAAVGAQTLGRFLPAWHGLGEPRPGMQALEEAIAQLENLPLPFSALCEGLLPARVASFHPDMLDMLCAQGSIVWIGSGALGASDGYIRLIRRERADLFVTAPTEPVPDNTLHQAIVAHLEKRGSAFTVELTQLAGGVSLDLLQSTLHDLIWTGHITNDTVQPLRNLGKKAPRARPGRLGRGAMRLSLGGRWSLVKSLALLPSPELSASEQETARLHAQAQLLLERYGIVAREAAAAESIVGGFSAVYPILKAMEEAGRVRRGYFVEGLGGAQFAYGGAIERLRRLGTESEVAQARGASTDDLLVLWAVDPANPYGSLLPWPKMAEPPEGPRPDAEKSRKKPRRVSGAQVILFRGAPLALLEAKGQHLLTFSALGADKRSYLACVEGLGRIRHTRRGRNLVLRQIDGEAALLSPFAAALLQAGLSRTFDGLCLPP